jgi:tRNA threonylcarbamoyladenosine biosynthesis protein TsaE
MRLTVGTPEAMRDLGERLADQLRPGDLVLLNGELGAGKTTLAQGIGRGLGVSGAVLSPTFVIARVHSDGRLPLVHVDAYRLSSIAEVDDLDLDASLEESVTVVEWGEGLVEALAGDRLEVSIERPADDSDETRVVEVTGVGPRWASYPGGN